MAIHLHRSNRTETLVEALCRVLGETRPPDPFLPYPVVVGSRGMERWLRHEIATRMDIATGLAFPFPRQALAGAARWLLDGATEPDAAFWEMDPAAKPEAQAWEGAALAFRLVGPLHSHLDEPAFGLVKQYLGEGRDPEKPDVVTARELLFAGEVGAALDRLMHDRPTLALEWASSPEAVKPKQVSEKEPGRRTDHRWLAHLLADLGASTDPHSPAVLHQKLIDSAPPKTGRSMCIFGLSTMGPGDRARLAAIAASIDVHLFVLIPTNHWIQFLRTKPEIGVALKNAKTDEEREELETQIAADNPILSTLGGPSRDLQVWLEEVTYEGDELADTQPADAQGPTLLQRLQRWILDARGLKEAGPPWTPDNSVSAHSTYGALRQCEVLRDALLGMFEKDPSLEPRDILVMTPDVETYAPLVDAVFSRTGRAQGDEPRNLPRIPVSIADLGLSRTNPVAEVLLQVLAVSGERLTASWLLDFLALKPVRDRWSLDDDDLADIREMVRESGLRWGADAEDRTTVDQPALDQNTARFALERLALGVLMPDEDGTGVVRGASRVLEPSAPLNVESRDRVRRVGQLAGILRTLAAHRRDLKGPATLPAWRSRLVAALDELAATTEKTGWLRTEVDAALDDLVETGKPLGDLEVAPAAVLRWLRGGFEIPQRGDRAITGAVQVCALEPMRSVPFRVVALLGMDDKAFPRGGRPRTWDPMEQAERGELDRRDIDRHLMLEAILSARDRLLLLWSGHEVEQGQKQPAAVPVEELLETLETLTGLEREQLVHEHPLQPWSATNFADEPRSFDQGMAQAAQRLREIESGKEEPRPLGLFARGTAGLLDELPPPQKLTLEELASGLLAPHKLLLKSRLGLSVAADEAAVEDREPLELDELEKWSLRRRIIGHAMPGRAPWTNELLAAASSEATLESAVASVRDRMAAEGVLPLRSGGRNVLASEKENAKAVLENLLAVGGTLRGEVLPLNVQLEGGPLLLGEADLVAEHDGARLLQWFTPSPKANERDKLIAWLYLLAAVASGEADVAARLVGYDSRGTNAKAGGDFLTIEDGADAARAKLGELVALWRIAHQRPLPLFRHTSSKVGEALEKGGDDVAKPGVRAALVQTVSQGWFGRFPTRGDIDDPWIATFFIDYDPVDHLDDEGDESLITLARWVWRPVARGLGRGKPLGETWLAR